MIDLAYEMLVIAAGEGGAAAGAQQQNPYAFFIMIGMMIFIFYFLIMRPQQKKQKEQAQMLSALKKGDRIITVGGLYGKITGLDENMVTLEIADRVRVKLSRTSVSGLAQNGAPAPKGG